MSAKTKKILLITIFVVATIAIALVLYFVFFQPFVSPPEPPVAPPAVAPPVGLPEVPPALNIPVAPPSANIPAVLPPEVNVPVTPTVPGPVISPEASGGITSFATIETNPAQNPTLANNGRDLIYHDKETGFFYSITPDGEKQLFSDTTFKNVENVTWSPNTQKAVMEYPDGSNIIYDFQQQRSVTLPAQWKDFTFSNTGDQLAFKDMRLDPENRYLAVANTDGTGYRKIEKMGDNDERVYVDWAPNNQYIALYSESIDGSRAEVYPIGFNGENFRKFRVEGRDLRFEWSPSGDKMVYSVFNSRSNYNPSLWVVNTNPELLATGRNKLELNTWADKCTFAAESTVYCAVPQNLETGTGFRPDLANNTPDVIYKIDLTTGTKELIAEPLYPSTIDQIIISEDDQYLYWIEQGTGQLKKMNL
jgi:hypothetical protein